jgi:hypothetical protein
MTHLKVTAHLQAPIAGEPPMLDAIVEYEMARIGGKLHSIDRSDLCPPAGEIHIPILRGCIGGVDQIPRCSSPIMVCENVRHEHYAKRIAVEYANLLRDNQRLVVSVGNTWTKSYRLPLMTTTTPRVVWFIGGNDSNRGDKPSPRKTLLSILQQVNSIGKKRSVGYGVVTRWEVEKIDGDYSWFAPGAGGTVLMRPLPSCDALPKDLVGHRQDFGACLPPYWHPDRYMEIVKPC